MTTQNPSARELVGCLERGDVAASLDRWVDCERDATAHVVAHLALIQREGIYVELGFASLYAYCRERLGYSRSATLKRIRAARAALVHPEIIDHLEVGALTLSSVNLLARHLTGGAFGTELLEACRFRSCREIEALIASRCPRPKSPRGDLRIKSAGPGLVRVEMIVSREVAEKLALARDIQRAQDPNSDAEEVLSAALDKFLADATRATGQTPRADTTDSVGGEEAWSRRNERAGASLAGAIDPLDALRRRGRLGARRRSDLVGVMTRLGYTRAEADDRARYALEKLGPDADSRSLCRAALESVGPPSGRRR